MPPDIEPSITGNRMADAFARAGVEKVEEPLQQPPGEVSEPPKAPEPKKEPETPVEPPKRDEVARQFAALSREKKQLKAMKAEIDQQRADIERFRYLQKLQQEDPLAFAEEVGLPYEKHTELMMKAPPRANAELRTIQKQFDELKAQIAERDAKIEAANYQQVISQSRSQVIDWLAEPTQAEAYPHIAAVGRDGREDVWLAIHDFAKQFPTEKLPPYEYFADKVEGHYKTQREALSKVGAKLTKKTEGATVTQVRPLPSAKAAGVPAADPSLEDEARLDPLERDLARMKRVMRFK